MIAVDPLGHGASDRPHASDAYLPSGVTADLVAVLDAEDVPRATVWGYSRGGWLAANLAGRHPERVERLVIGAYAMHAHADEVDRTLVGLVEMLRDGDWTGVWTTFGITDTAVTAMLEDGNDALAVAAAITGSMCPTRYVARAARPTGAPHQRRHRHPGGRVDVVGPLVVGVEVAVGGDPASIACPVACYVGSREWILPHVRADVAALGAHRATLDVIAGQTHFGVFLAAAHPVLAAVTARLRG